MTGPSTSSAPPALSARSVTLSLLLGAGPSHRMSPATLIRCGEHFGIPASTLRVALTRAVAAGDLVRVDGAYAIGPRLLRRQRRQDEAVLDAATAWDGSWEMAVVTVTGRPGPERAALRDLLDDHRMAELREGVWTRPANLGRPASYGDSRVLDVFTARPAGDAVELAARLWDLPRWSRDGLRLGEQLTHTTEPADRLAVAAQLVRHLARDPLLPAELLPPDWPAGALRADYASYQEELRGLF